MGATGVMNGNTKAIVLPMSELGQQATSRAWVDIQCLQLSAASRSSACGSRMARTAQVLPLCEDKLGALSRRGTMESFTNLDETHGRMAKCTACSGIILLPREVLKSASSDTC